MKKIIYLFFVILFIPVNSIAEPNNTVLNLMNERVSMLDWGIYRLEKELVENNNFFSIKFRKKYNTNNNDTSISVNYNWDENKIFVSLNDTMDINVIFEKDIEYCNSDNYIIIDENIIYEEIKKIIEKLKMEISLNRHLFQHSGYKNSNVPENFHQKIIELFEISVSIKIACISDDKDVYECQSNLKTNKIFCTKYSFIKQLKSDIKEMKEMK